MIVRFPDLAEASPPEPAVVGSKAASLIRMASAGLPVPPGAVLPVSYFAPWIEAVNATDAWSRLIGASPEDWPRLCDVLKQHVPRLRWSDAQQRALAALRQELRRELQGRGTLLPADGGGVGLGE